MIAQQYEQQSAVNVSYNQTYYGLVLNLQDALLILEGIRLDILPKVQRRLNDFERKCIVAGSIYAWNKNALGIKRWTDGKSWSASQVKGPFLIYQENDGSRKVKPNGLVKQSFSLTTKQNEKFHLIAYYDPARRAKGVTTGKIPSQDPNLLKLQLNPAVYLADVFHCGVPDLMSFLPQQNYMQFSSASTAYPSCKSSTFSAGMGNTQPSSKTNSSNGNVFTYNQQMYQPQSQPTYYCHPHMMTYQYIPSSNTPQSFYPQQQVFMQLMPAQSHSYAYGMTGMSGIELDSYVQRASVGSVLSGLPTPATSSSSRLSFSATHTPSTTSEQYAGMSPATSHSKPLESPNFSYWKKSPQSPHSMPSPSSDRTSYQAVPEADHNPALAGSMCGVPQVVLIGS